MKRFYCTTCKLVKRVRVFPDNVQENANIDVSKQPGRRFFGTCRSHDSDGASRAQLNKRVRVLKTIKKVKSSPAPAAPARRK